MIEVAILDNSEMSEGIMIEDSLSTAGIYLECLSLCFQCKHQVERTKRACAFVWK